MKIPRPSASRRRAPWLVTSLLAVLLVLVPVLAWFQFQWTGEASRAEVFRMRSNLHAALVRFSTEFDRATTLDQDPILPPDGRQVAQTDAQALERAGAQLSSWAALTDAPGLVKGIWVVGDGQAWHTSAPVVRWEPPVSADQVPNSALRASLPLTRNPGRRLVVELNASVLLTAVVPRLASSIFGGSDGLPGYALVLRDTATQDVLWTSEPGEVPPTTEAEMAMGLLGGDRFGPLLIAPLASGDVFTLPPPASSGRTGRSLEAAAERVRWLNFGATAALLAVLTGGFLVVLRLYNRNRLAVRAQQDFVSSVSHELKSPLAVLRAAAENLKEGVVSDPKQAQRYGERMLAEADRLLMLTDNILRYAGLEGQATRTEDVVALDLGQLVVERREAWAPAYAAKSVALQSHLPADAVVVRGRRAEVSAIVDNLLSNALKHGTTHTQPAVTVSCGLRMGRRDPEAWLAVEDNGRGLAPREHRRVFEPFYRPQGTTVAGVGLGLSLVARLAAAQGGRVGVRSAPGAGARFEVVLPLAEDEHP